MTDRDYAIKSMKEITFQMASHAQDYLEVTIERHYTDIKELMTSYQKLILENQIVLEELDMECQEKINEDMAYALSYLSIYNNQLNVPKMHREMNNLMIIYGLSDMIYRGMTLVKFYAPNGVMLSEILHSCFCSHYNKTDVELFWIVFNFTDSLLFFDYDKMFCVLMENEICQKVCEKNKYNSWMKLIGNYCFQVV